MWLEQVFVRRNKDLHLWLSLASLLCSRLHFLVRDRYPCGNYDPIQMRSIIEHCIFHVMPLVDRHFKPDDKVYIYSFSSNDRIISIFVWRIVKVMVISRCFSNHISFGGIQIHTFTSPRPRLNTICSPCAWTCVHLALKSMHRVVVQVLVPPSESLSKSKHCMLVGDKST